MSVLKYRELCQRIAKAEKFMDSQASANEKDKWFPELMDLINEQCVIARQLGLTKEECREHMESVR